MQREFTTVINHAIADAYRAGLDYTGATRYAVRAVMRVHPDLDSTEAMAVVNRFRENRQMASHSATAIS